MLHSISTNISSVLYIDMLSYTCRDEGLQMSCLKLCLAMVHNTTEHGSDGKLHVKDMIFHRKCVMFFLPSAEDAFRRHSSYRCREVIKFLYSQTT